MEKEFVPYEQALELKELGFDELCFGRYIYDGIGKEWFLVQTQQTKSASVIFEGDKSVDGISIAAPTFSQAFRWFIKTKGIKGEVDYANLDWSKWNFNITLKRSTFTLYNGFARIEKSFDSYKEAELACLKKLIETVKVC